MVKDINPGPGSSFFTEFTAVGSTLYSRSMMARTAPKSGRATGPRRGR